VSELLSFLDKNSIYIVLAILIVIWFGIYMFLLNTDKRLRRIEAELDLQNSSDDKNFVKNSNGETQNEK